MLPRILPSIFIIYVLAFAFSGCGTIIRGTEQDVMITSNPSGARATIDQKITVVTPDVVSLSRRKSHDIKFEKEGYEPTQIKVKKKLDWYIITNIMTNYTTLPITTLPIAVNFPPYITMVIGGIIDYTIGGGYALSPKQVYVKMQMKEQDLKEGYNIGNFTPINVDQEHVTKAKRSSKLIITDRAGKCFMGNLYGVQDDVLLLCSLSWGEKLTGIKLSEISKIEIERKPDVTREFIDGALIGDLTASALLLPHLEYNLDFFFAMFGSPVLGICFGCPIGSIIGMAKGINTNIDFSTLSESDKLKTITTLLGKD